MPLDTTYVVWPYSNVTDYHNIAHYRNRRKVIVAYGGVQLAPLPFFLSMQQGYMEKVASVSPILQYRPTFQKLTPSLKEAKGQKKQLLVYYLSVKRRLLDCHKFWEPIRRRRCCWS